MSKNKRNNFQKCCGKRAEIGRLGRGPLAREHERTGRSENGRGCVSIEKASASKVRRRKTFTMSTVRLYYDLENV